MATKGDEAFTALGTVEVDEAATAASLARTEKLVRASMDRSSQTFESFSIRAKKAMDDAVTRAQPRKGFGVAQFGEYQRQHGPGGTGGAGQAATAAIKTSSAEAVKSFAAAGHAAENMRHRFKSLLSAALAFVPGAGYVRQHMNQMTGGIFAGTGGLTKMALAFSGATAVVVVAALAISHYVEKVNRMAEAQFSANRAVKTLDMGRATQGFTEANEALEKYKQDLSGTSIIRDWVAGYQRLSGVVAENVEKQKIFAAAVKQIFEAVIVPKAAIEAAKAFSEIGEKQGRRAVVNAANAGQTAAGYAKITAEMKAQSALNKAEIDLEEKTDIGLEGANLKGRNQAEVEKIYTKKRLVEDARLKESLAGLTDEIAKNRAEQIRADSELTASLLTSAAKRAGSYDEELRLVGETFDVRRTALMREVALGVNVQQNRRALVRLDDEQKTAAVDLAAKRVKAEADQAESAVVNEGRRARASAESRAEILENESAIAQARSERSGQGVDVAALTGKQDAAREKLAAAQEQERSELEETHGIRKRQLQETIALGVDVIANKALLAKAEDDFATRSSEIADRAAAKESSLRRAQAEERQAAFDKEMARAERRVGQILQLTGGTMQQQANATVTLLGHLEKGSEAWWAQLVKVNDQMKAIQQAGQSAAQAMVGAAKATGMTHGTKKDAQKAYDKQVKDDEKIRRNFEGGKRVDLSKWEAAMGRQNQSRDIEKNFGGDINRALGAASMDPTARTKMVTGWADGFASVDVVIDDFIARTNEKLGALGTTLGDSTTAKIKDTVARGLYLEGKRGPLGPPADAAGDA